MLYIILGYLFVSLLLAGLFWLALIVAKRSDERNPVDLSEGESDDVEEAAVLDPPRRDEVYR